MRQRYLLLVALILAIAPEIHAVPWFPFGPDGGDARAFAADSRDHAHLYLGTSNGWMYQSHDGGKKWERLASVGKRNDLVLDNIVIDPADPKHIVVGAWKLAELHHPDGGIYISQDGGETWTSSADMQGQSVLALVVAPSDPKIMVAGSMEGVFRSSDSGAHWQQISSKGDRELHEVESLAIDPANPLVIYAGTWHLPWKTTDGGATWTNIKDGIIEDSDVFSIIVDPKQPSVVYLSACSGIYRSDSGGTKFAKAQGIPTTARRTRVLMQDPTQLATVFAGTTEGLYRTVDSGKTWALTTGPDLIINDVYVDPADSKHVLLATDRQGVLESKDGGSKFESSNSGFSRRQITAYTGDAQHPATVYVGVENDKDWGGVFVSHSGGLSWTQLSSGLGGRDVFSLGQAEDGTIVAGTAHGIFTLKGDAWQRAAADATPPPAAAKARKPGVSAAQAKPVAAKPRSATAAKAFDGSVFSFAATGDAMFAATSAGLLRSVSNGSTWKLAPSIPMDEYRFMAASKRNVVAASLTAAELSADGGATWERVTLPEEVTQVTAVSVDGEGRVWIAGRIGVSYSTDKGATWQTVKDLYVRNANSIYYDEAKNRMLVTSGELVTVAFGVQLPAMQLSSWDTGWNLRFVRPVGDHLVAGTWFDGVVVQPTMVDSAVPAPAMAH